MTKGVKLRSEFDRQKNESLKYNFFHKYYI